MSNVQTTMLDPFPYKFENPNNAKVVPDDVFSGVNAIMVPDGFVIPGHRNGGVYIMVQDSQDITKTTKTVKITNNIDGTWYHTGNWVDMNGDGRKDLLIARTNAKAQREGDGELLWLEHPAADALDGSAWTEHVITTGPDVWTSIDTMAAYPGELIVWSAQFFDETVSVHRVSLTDGSMIGSRVIDDNTIAMEGYKVMRGFKFHPVDLNGDGNK